MALMVHSRIHGKHPELSDEDVRAAFFSIVRYAQRQTGEYVGIGVDGKGRLVELVFREVEGGVLIYHGLTPPTRNVLDTLERRGW